jgi:hypothetical protein
MVMKQSDIVEQQVRLVDLFEVDQTTNTNSRHETVFTVVIGYKLKEKTKKYA